MLVDSLHVEPIVIYVYNYIGRGPETNDEGLEPGFDRLPVSSLAGTRPRCPNH